MVMVGKPLCWKSLGTEEREKCSFCLTNTLFWVGGALIVIFLTPPGWLVNINHSLGWYNIWESNPTWLKHGGYALIIHQIALDDEKCQWMLLPAKKYHHIVTMFLASNKRVNTWKMIENSLLSLSPKCLRLTFIRYGSNFGSSSGCSCT